MNKIKVSAFAHNVFVSIVLLAVLLAVISGIMVAAGRNPLAKFPLEIQLQATHLFAPKMSDQEADDYWQNLVPLAEQYWGKKACDEVKVFNGDLGQHAAGRALIPGCVIWINTKLVGQRMSLRQQCLMIFHEYGHSLGHPHTDPKQLTSNTRHSSKGLMDATARNYSTKIDICEAYARNELPVFKQTNSKKLWFFSQSDEFLFRSEYRVSVKDAKHVAHQNQLGTILTCETNNPKSVTCFVKNKGLLAVKVQRVSPHFVMIKTKRLDL